MSDDQKRGEAIRKAAEADAKRKAEERKKQAAKEAALLRESEAKREKKLRERGW